MKAFTYGALTVGGVALAGYELVQDAPWQLGFVFGVIVAICGAIGVSDLKASPVVNVTNVYDDAPPPGADVVPIERRPPA